MKMIVTDSVEGCEQENPFVILKLVGVPADRLPALHKYLESDGVIADPTTDSPGYCNGEDPVFGSPRIARIQCSRLDDKTGRYVIEVKVFVSLGTGKRARGNRHTAFTPRDVFDGIYDAIGWFPTGK